jgi:alpha-1,6-mannosyltransferase
LTLRAGGVASLDPFRPLAVCDITEYYGETSGGVRTYLREKARFIDARAGCRQVLIVPGAADTATAEGSVRRYEVAAPLIPGQAPYRAMVAPRRVRRILESERPDLIELGSSHAVPWLVRAPARRLDIPVVWFLHGHLPRIIAPHLEHDRPHRWLAARAAIRYIRAIAAGVERILVASDFVRDDLERFGLERVVRVPLGVDTGTFHPSRRGRAEATRSRLGLTGPFAMYAGRLTAEKELDTAVEGWRRLRRDDVTLLLVGAGPHEPRLRARAGPTVRVMPYNHDRELLADLHAAAEL